MIEVIYKEENQEAQEEAFVQIPRNIRQIGQADENCKIYIEDYVYTFLVRLSRSEEEKARVAILTGESRWYGGTSYLFIKGALMVEEMEAALDHIDFTEEIWQKVYEEQKKYFGEQEITGWFFSQSQISMEVNEVFTRVHLKHFGGEKVLMLMEPQEREDAFFRYENGFMGRQSGYYIYYEKNPQMQAYMIEKNKELQPEITEKCEDKAVKNFRKIIADRKQDEEERTSVFSYAATACLAVAVLMVGVNFYRNYQNMKSIEKEIQQASSIIVEEVTPVPTKKALKPTEIPEEKKMVPTQAPEKKETVPTPIPAVTEPAEVKKNEKEESGETSGDHVYSEEADVRKAERRKALEEKETQAASDEVHESYVIKPGDTIFQISMARYGSMDAMDEICRLNGLSLEEIIYPGQVIVLP